MKTYYKLRKVVDKLLLVERWYCAILLVIMLAICFVQVIRRYVLGNPWSWSDEVILFIMAWFAFPAMNLNVWNDNHFNIAAVYNRFPAALQKCADVVRHVLVGTFMVLLSYYSYKMTVQYMPKALSVTGIPQGLKYIPVLVTGILSTLFCIINLIGVFVPKETEEVEE